MRTAASVFLIFLSVPLFVILIIASIVKFQLLEPIFWESAFEKNNVYSSLTTIVKQSIIQKTVNAGGRPSEITAITDVINEANVKDFVNKNLENLLNFANNKTPQLMVYIPVQKLPAGLLPSEFEKQPEIMPLITLLAKLNIEGITQAQIQYISLLGRVSAYVILFGSILFVLSIIFLFILTERGYRFIGPGVSFVLCGFASLSLFYYGNILITDLMQILSQKPDSAQLIAGAVAPPLIHELLSSFLIAGVLMLAIGTIFFFLRKGKLAASN